jgi:hypothetical protein
MMLPGVGCTLHHGQRRIVPLVIVAVQEDELRPQMRFFAGSDHLGNVDTGPEEFEVLHNPVGVVFCQSNAQLLVSC